MVERTQSSKPTLTGEVNSPCHNQNNADGIRGKPIGECPNTTALTQNSEPEIEVSMEAVVERENMWSAYHRVVSNNGAPGVDDMPVEELAEYLRYEWPRIKKELLEGDYLPNPVRGADIPKSGGKGMRRLGIPTVVDRLIQQAVHQVLQKLFEPTFSESSYGYRPGRSAQQAVQQARTFMRYGYQWVVDLDLEKFFDTVNHDILMSRLARRVKDKRLLRLIRRFLQAGMMYDGLTSPRVDGTPQGGPLSPLLSNILLDELDKELESRGHRFCRFADDCNIYVRSEAAGQRVLSSVARFLNMKLRLKVNETKSAVDRPWRRKFLGFSFTYEEFPRITVSKEACKQFRYKMKVHFRRGRGQHIPTFLENLRPRIIGWRNYYGHADTKRPFVHLDKWLRRRLRVVIWRQWKTPKRRVKELMRLGGVSLSVARGCASNSCGPWRNSKTAVIHKALSNTYLAELGLASLIS